MPSMPSVLNNLLSQKTRKKGINIWHAVLNTLSKKKKERRNMGL